MEIFTNNIVLFDEGMVAKGAFDDVVATIDHNIYWNSKNKSYDFNKHTFKEWQNIGFDRNSYLIAPRFKDAENFDFRFRSKKSYQKINFKPFDYSKAGVYGSKDWKKKAELAAYLKINFDKIVKKLEYHESS